MMMMMMMISSPCLITLMHDHGLFKTDMTFCVRQSSFRCESHYAVSVIRRVAVKRIPPLPGTSSECEIARSESYKQNHLGQEQL